MGSSFYTALDLTLGEEGGYSNIAADRGGETWRGISRKNWPNWEGWAIVDAYKDAGTLERLPSNPQLVTLVTDFYYQNFWRPIGAEHIESQAIANELFDTAVNQGPRAAVRYLQRALNKLNRRGNRWADITVDGDCGPQTLAAMTSFGSHCTRSWKGRRFRRAMLVMLNYQQMEVYWNLMDRDESQEEFAVGWSARAATIEEH